MFALVSSVRHSSVRVVRLLCVPPAPPVVTRRCVCVRTFILVHCACMRAVREFLFVRYWWHEKRGVRTGRAQFRDTLRDIHYVVLPDRTLYEICAVFVILRGTRVSRHPCRVHASAGGDTRPPRKHPSVRTPRGKAASSLHLSFSLFAPSLSLSSSLPYSQLHACGIAVALPMCTFT